MTLSLTRLSQVFLAALFTGCFSVGLQAQQRIIYVTEAGAGNQNGSSWENATSDLYGSTKRFDYDEIWVAEGTYTPTVCSNCNESDRRRFFSLGEAKTIIGGFTGTETSRSQASPSVRTVLSGDIDGDGAALDADNSFTVVVCADCGESAGLENLVITGGYANGSEVAGESGVSGSAFYVRGNNGQTGSPKVRQCTFENNFSAGGGGAVFINGTGKPGNLGNSNSRFSDCLFTGNISNADGGALYISGAGFAEDESIQSPNASSLVLERCRFIDNYTTYVSGPGGNSGGAVYATAARGSLTLTFNRVLFQENACLDDSNTGRASSNGGAIYFQVDALKLGSLNAAFSNSIFLNNTAYAGGAYYGNRATSTFENVTITGNSAIGTSGTGGGIYTNTGSSEIVNSIIYGNNTANTPPSATLRNVNAEVAISYSLVGVNSCDSLNSKVNDEDISSVECGDGMLYAVNPQFDFSNGLPELLETSPAVNVGDNSASAGPSDYLNNERIGGDTVDMGAFEWGAVPLPVELLAFGANPQADHIDLDWRTAAEIDLEGYRLERSSDGLSFEGISFTNAAALGGYTYTDFTALPQTTYYYRLVSVDFDGTTYTSDLVTAQLGVDTGAGLVRRTYPNPTSGNLVIHLSESNRGPDLRASLYDGLGREVQRWSEPGSTGAMQLDLGGFANGLYTLSVARGGHTETLRIVLRH